MAHATHEGKPRQLPLPPCRGCLSFPHLPCTCPAAAPLFFVEKRKRAAAGTLPTRPSPAAPRVASPVGTTGCIRLRGIAAPLTPHSAGGALPQAVRPRLVHLSIQPPPGCGAAPRPARPPAHRHRLPRHEAGRPAPRGLARERRLQRCRAQGSPAVRAGMLREAAGRLTAGTPAVPSFRGSFSHGARKYLPISVAFAACRPCAPSESLLPPPAQPPLFHASVAPSRRGRAQVATAARLRTTCLNTGCTRRGIAPSCATTARPASAGSAFLRTSEQRSTATLLPGCSGRGGGLRAWLAWQLPGQLPWSASCCCCCCCVCCLLLMLRCCLLIAALLCTETWRLLLCWHCALQPGGASSAGVQALAALGRGGRSQRGDKCQRQGPRAGFASTAQPAGPGAASGTGRSAAAAAPAAASKTAGAAAGDGSAAAIARHGNAQRGRRGHAPRARGSAEAAAAPAGVSMAEAVGGLAPWPPVAGAPHGTAKCRPAHPRAVCGQATLHPALQSPAPPAAACCASYAACAHRSCVRPAGPRACCLAAGGRHLCCGGPRAGPAGAGGRVCGQERRHPAAPAAPR